MINKLSLQILSLRKAFEKQTQTIQDQVKNKANEDHRKQLVKSDALVRK